MSNTAPLQYESLKIVLQYMDPNVRFKVSSRAPSIRTTDQIIPLKLKSLSFDTNETKINDATYRVGLFRKYKRGRQIPKCHQLANENGGESNDYTKQGFKVKYPGHVVYPGDVDLAIMMSSYDLVDNQQQTVLEKQIETYEKAIARKVAREGLLNTAQEPDGTMNMEPAEGDRLVECSIHHLQESIDEFKTQLVPYYCRRNREPLPFTMVIQLTVQSSKGVQIYRHLHNMKLQQALKQVNTFLFGNRRCSIQSRALCVIKPAIVLRLPVGVRFQIRELSIEGKLISENGSITSVLDDSSYPLDRLDFRSSPVEDTDDFNHHAVKAAKLLVIKPHGAIFDRYLPILLNSHNRVVVTDFRLSTNFPLDDQIRLISHWLRTDRESGTLLSFLVKEEGDVNQLMLRIEQQHGVALNDRSIRIPMNMDRELEVCYAPRVQIEDEWAPKWTVTMRVVAASG